MESHAIAFDTFDRENPHIWRLFCRFTMNLIAVGWKHYSARTVIHRIRWHVDTQTNDPCFKINNNHSPFYARKFMAQYPQHDGFFHTRDAEADDQEPVVQRQERMFG